MKAYYRIFILLILIVLISSCGGGETDNISLLLSEYKQLGEMKLKYSENFSCIYFDSFKVLKIRMQNNTEEYCVLSNSSEILGILEKRYKGEDAVFIKTPAVKVASFSSQNIAFFNALGLIERIKAVDSRRNISNKTVLGRIDNGETAEAGEGRDIDTEKLFQISPDLILSSGTGENFGQLKNTVITSEWLEKTPLARAEWIKCTALFFDCEEKASAVFSDIEANYLNLKKAACKTESRVSVIVNTVYGGSWGVPGGKSYAAALFSDAGLSYPWTDNNSSGSIFLDFETVLEKGRDADIWLINSSGINTISELLKSDRRYSFFSAAENGSVYNNNKNVSEYGNPYWEEGILYPDRILSDLIKIAHPETENSNPFFFYKKLSL